MQNKRKSPLSRDFQLRATIEQARELAMQKCAAFDRELTQLKLELAQGKADLAAAQAEFAQGNPSAELTAKIRAFPRRKAYLQMKLAALEEASAAAVEAKDRLIAIHTEAADEETRDIYERMHGLLAYGAAMGTNTPDCQLLHDSIGDYLEASSPGDRKAAERSISLIFEHGDLGDKDRKAAREDDRILKEFEAISNPESRSAFYSQHKAQIMAAYDARKNNP
jgi:hypothetical protein